MNAYSCITHTLTFRSCEIKAIFPHRPKRHIEAQGDEYAENKVSLPKPRQQVVTEVVHVVRRLIERRKPADSHVRLVHQLIRQLEYGLYGLRVEKKAEQAERKHGYYPRKLPFFQVEQQHDKYHQQRVKEHEQENRRHALIRAAHFKRFDKRRQRNLLPRAGIAEDCGGFRPHIADKALPHTDEGGGDEYERKVDKRGQGYIYRLPHEPCFAVYPHEVKGRAAGYKGHIRKQQQQEQRGKQDGVAVPEGPDEGFHKLHGGIVFLCELDRLVREQKAQHEGKAEGDDDAGVFVPLAEVVFSHGKNLFQLHMRSSLLFAANAKPSPMSTLNSMSSTATPILPNIHFDEGLSHSRGYSTNSLSK